jgi:hypothetical protein
MLTLARMRPKTLFVALSVVGLLSTAIFPVETMRFLTRVMPWVVTRDRLALHNQSPQAFLQRSFGPDPVASDDEYMPMFNAPTVGKVSATFFSVGMLILFLTAFRVRPRSFEEVRLGYSLAILALVVLPRMTEFHHMLWCLVPIVILASHVMQDDRPLRRKRVLGGIVVASILISFPPFMPSIQQALHGLLHTPVGPVVASYSAFGLVGLFLMNWRLLMDVQRSHRQATPLEVA